MQPCLSYPYYIQVLLLGKVSQFLRFVEKGTGIEHSERRERINNSRPQGGENPTALPLVRPLGNPRPALHTRWRPIPAELVFVTLNAGSLLNKTEELADLGRQKNLDMIGVTETWLQVGIRGDEICLPGNTLFRQDRPSH